MTTYSSGKAPRRLAQLVALVILCCAGGATSVLGQGGSGREITGAPASEKKHAKKASTREASTTADSQMRKSAAPAASDSPSSTPQSNALGVSTVGQIDLEGLKKLLERDVTDPQPLLINFWATWCDPCREEFPDLVKIDADYRAKKLNVVAVSLDDIAEIGTTVPRFLTEMKASMPVVLLNVNDPEPAIKLIDTSWDGQLPATFLFDKDGKVVFRHFGRFKTDELRAAIEQAVGSKQ